jgi:hypothetical protein
MSVVMFDCSFEYQKGLLRGVVGARKKVTSGRESQISLKI